MRPGRTELEVGRELEVLMLDHGADGVSFETIVASGANSAIPHHRPTAAVLAAGDFVKIDFGALVGGYHSDMTRTFVLGKASLTGSWKYTSWRVMRNEPAGLHWKPEPAWPTWMRRRAR